MRTFAALLVVLLGCGQATQTQADAGACDVSPDAKQLQAKVFGRGCAGSNSCHSAVGQQAALDLSTVEATCAALKGVPSCEFPSKLRVAPGRPADSFLIEKLTCPASGCVGLPDPRCSATVNHPMPAGGFPLDACELSALVTWVELGMPGCP